MRSNQKTKNYKRKLYFPVPHVLSSCLEAICLQTPSNHLLLFDFSFCLQPLPESEYNGNPETVGYRVRFWRADLEGDARSQLVSDRMARELTLEGLEEWTEYALQIQAYNSIGPGPWSKNIKGRTRESGE